MLFILVIEYRVIVEIGTENVDNVNCTVFRSLVTETMHNTSWIYNK